MKKSSAFSRNLLTAGMGPVDTAVIKATFDDDYPPKDKHLQTLFDEIRVRRLCLFYPTLFSRLHDKSFRVVLKAAIVLHRICRDCEYNPLVRLLQNYNSLIPLYNFSDNQNARYSVLVRNYAQYLFAKMHFYHTYRFSPERVSPANGKEWCDKLSLAQAVTILPILQEQLLKLTSIIPSYPMQPIEENIHILLFRDGMRLYAIISLLVPRVTNNLEECDTEMTTTLYKACIKLADVNKKLVYWYESLVRANITSDSVPKVTDLPQSFLDALQTHLQSLKKSHVDEIHADIGYDPNNDDEFSDDEFTTSPNPNKSNNTTPALGVNSAKTVSPQLQQKQQQQQQQQQQAPVLSTHKNHPPPPSYTESTVQLDQFLHTPKVSSTAPKQGKSNALDNSDPFILSGAGGANDDPFGSDPFIASQTNTKPAAATTTSTTTAAAAADPFATLSADDDPFAMLANLNFDTPTSNPTTNNTTSTNTSTMNARHDPFSELLNKSSKPQHQQPYAPRGSLSGPVPVPGADPFATFATPQATAPPTQQYALIEMNVAQPLVYVNPFETKDHNFINQPPPFNPYVNAQNSNLLYQPAVHVPPMYDPFSAASQQYNTTFLPPPQAQQPYMQQPHQQPYMYPQAQQPYMQQPPPYYPQQQQQQQQQNKNVDPFELPF